MVVFRALAIAGLLLAAVIPSRAQDYPARPVTIVVPTGPGGGMEMVARLVAPKLEQRFGKPFVIENRPGAGTNIGAAAVARAAPDGTHAVDGDLVDHGDQCRASTKACRSTR